MEKTGGYKKIALTCSSCFHVVDCAKDYFGTKYFLAPHSSDTSYTFNCAKCSTKPSLIHHKHKKWIDIALCALTTLEMMVGWCMFESNDVSSFIDSHYEILAINKKRLNVRRHWTERLQSKIANSGYIHSKTIGGTIYYSTYRKGIPASTPAQFIVEEILKERKNATGEIECKVKWEGFSKKYATWEPEANVRGKKPATPKKSSDDVILVKEEDSDEDCVAPRTRRNASMAKAPLATSTPTSNKKRKALETGPDPTPPSSDFSPAVHKNPDIRETISDKSISPLPASMPSPIPPIPPSTPSNLSLSTSSNSTQDGESIQDKEVETSTLHHTFVPLCSKCGTGVPVTELGYNIVTPTCERWTLECSTCTKGKPLVTHCTSASFREVILRALFLLSVKNPCKGYWSADDIVGLLTTHPDSFASVYNYSNKSDSDLRRRVRNNVITYAQVLSKSHGAGLYQYNYPPSSTEPQKRKRKSIKRVPSENELPLQYECAVLPDVFIGWEGSDNFFGFLRMSLDASLTELRSEIVSKSLLGPNDLFKFLYKKVPIQVPQESTLCVRECVGKNENGYYLLLKALPANLTREVLLV